MERLAKELDLLIGKLSDKSELQGRLSNLVSVYPFNEYEYIISHLLAADILTIDSYIELRDNYLERNMFLYIYEISAPRTFGETWAQGHLKELVPSLKKPSKKNDPEYSGQYDFYLDGIRIEVKASRAVDANMDGPLYMKALSSDTKKDFWMNFQQIKPACCDVFVWVSVWRDVIKYWVLSSSEVETNSYYSHGQHRGNIGEGQLHIKKDNISDFDSYLVRSDHLKRAIKSANKRNDKIT